MPTVGAQSCIPHDYCFDGKNDDCLPCVPYIALSISYMSIDHLQVEEWLGTKLKRLPIIRGL